MTRRGFIVDVDAVASRPVTRRRKRNSAEPASNSSTEGTPQRVIDAAIACILAKGYYRASSNEIARWAGLTWGVIQYHFGTREGLMLAAFRDQVKKLIDHSESYVFTGETTHEQLWSTYDFLYQFFGQREYLASLEINLNLVRTPSTEEAVRAETERLRDALVQVGIRNPAHVVSNGMAVEVLRSVILSHRLRADASLTVVVDEEKDFLERVEMLIDALAGGLEKA
jgi:AcrR family transcriptional regulator